MGTMAGITTTGITVTGDGAIITGVTGTGTIVTGDRWPSNKKTPRQAGFLK
jgi:hypothetical protein